MDNALIQLDGIQFAYGGRPPVLDGLDLTVRAGDRIGLKGANGSGKTTLLHLILGLLHPTRGTVRIFGEARRTERVWETGSCSTFGRWTRSLT